MFTQKPTWRTLLHLQKQSWIEVHQYLLLYLKANWDQFLLQKAAELQGRIKRSPGRLWVFITGCHHSGSIVPRGTPGQPNTSHVKHCRSSKTRDEDFHLRNSKHSLWVHSCWIMKDYLLSFHRRKRLSSCRGLPRTQHKGAVPEEWQWHQTSPWARGAPCPVPVLSAPAHHCRTWGSSSLHRHSLGDLHTGTEMDFLVPGTLTPEVLLQRHHQILVCNSSHSLQIPATQDSQERKINNIRHPLSLVSK